MPTKAQLAARKAVATMRRNKGERAAARWKPTSSRLMDIRMGQKQKRVDRANRAVGKRHKGKKGKGMPANVKQYFKNLNAGMSKEAARKAAGLPPKGKSSGRKPWGPGNPLYEWHMKHRK